MPSALTYRTGASHAPGGALARLPLLRAAPNPLHDPLDLPRRNRNAAGLLQMPFGFQVGRLVGAFQTDQLGQRRRIAHFQTQGGVGGMVALLLAGVIVVIPLQWEAAEEALHPDGFPALARLSGLGLVAGIGPVRRFLEQPADQRIGGLEHRRAHQHFQLRHALTVQFPGFEACDQLLDFFFLGEADGRRERFFFFAAAMLWRVSWMTRSAYSSVSCR